MPRYRVIVYESRQRHQVVELEAADPASAAEMAPNHLPDAAWQTDDTWLDPIDVASDVDEIAAS